MKPAFLQKLLFTSALLFTLDGCAPAVFLGSAGTVTSSAVEERGITGALTDSSIKQRINMKWVSRRARLMKMVEVSVREGRVLLSGSVDSPEDHVEAVRLVWEVDGVREVIDQIIVGEGSGFWGYMGDSWVTTKVKTALLSDKEIASVNLNLKTVEGTLYIMGIARSKAELEKAITIARNVAGVKKVVSYARIRDQFTSPTDVRKADYAGYAKDEDHSYETTSGNYAPDAVVVEDLSGPNNSSAFD